MVTPLALQCSTKNNKLKPTMAAYGLKIPYNNKSNKNNKNKGYIIQGIQSILIHLTRNVIKI